MSVSECDRHPSRARLMLVMSLKIDEKTSESHLGKFLIVRDDDGNIELLSTSPRRGSHIFKSHYCALNHLPYLVCKVRVWRRDLPPALGSVR